MRRQSFEEVAITERLERIERSRLNGTIQQGWKLDLECPLADCFFASSLSSERIHLYGSGSQSYGHQIIRSLHVTLFSGGVRTTRSTIRTHKATVSTIYSCSASAKRCDGLTLVRCVCPRH